ncbi:putative minor capsid protein [Bacillus benzoevorans]|uniref:Minor capsid protein n=1 Tax=Bacillus benzoevorans TaxID=1456 RepID=A0A7X0HV28_9BACI|nr:putative minor capsid protein [Bacillus benzoevorans]MBB6446462.1 hypothetical protein [Bacillus benzoevorans]
MNIKPIPRTLLIHTVNYEEFVQGDGFETEGSFKTPVTLSNVRIQTASNKSKPNISRDYYAEQLIWTALLFYDVVNSSSSAPFEFKEKAKVTFEGKTMTIEKVKPIYGLSLHHYELEMI